MGKEYTKILIPKKGLLVRDPSSMTPLAEIGEEKPWTGRDGRYWKRRLKDGDVIVVPKISKVSKTIKDKGNK